MQRKRLSKKSIYIWKIRLILVMVFWWFFCGAAAVFSFIAAGILAAMSLSVYLFCSLYYIKRLYRTYTYTIGKNNVSIRKGVFICKRIYISKNCVQYSQIIQTPLQRIFKTCTIAYQVAGAVIYLSQIDIKESNGAMFK